MTKLSLKAARINAGLTQRQAAALLKISTPTLIKWEQGKTFPNASMIEKICGMYDVHYDDISFCQSVSLKRTKSCD